MSDLGDITVIIRYAEQGLVNRLRAWAKKNRARVDLQQYTKGAYSGIVTVTSRWDEGRDSVLARVESMRALEGWNKHTERGF
jgi:hypothetical protein